MRVIILGSGSYSGTPRPLCNCENCVRARKYPQYMRTRFSVFIPEIKALVDPSPDLHYHLKHLNMDVKKVFITHAHFDHIAGLPELQIFRGIKFYSHEYAVNIAKHLQELFLGGRDWKYIPLEFNRWYDFGFRVYHFPTVHQPIEFAGGFVIEIGKNRIAITGDTGPEILNDENAIEVMRGVDLLIAEMTRKQSIPGTHLGVEDAIKLAQKVEAKKIVFAHISHSNYTQEKLEDIVRDYGYIIARDFTYVEI